jgi:predicted histone-like DNA-binding protein
MKFRIKKETKPKLSTFGKYKAVAVHYQTIDSKQICKETAQRMGTTEGTIHGVLISLAEVVNRHLREGDKVRLPEWGMLKLEIESEKVDTPKDFRAKKHIRGVRLHFIPESYEGTQPLYDGLTFSKDKSFQEE